MSGWLATVLLVAERARAAPALILVRFAGMLMAVALVCAVSLYSGAMADTLLQASLSPHGEDVLLTVSSSPGEPTKMPYARLAALDRYLHIAAGGDLGLPIRDVAAHFNVSVSWPVVTWGRQGDASVAPLGAAYLEYFGGFADHVRVQAGSLSRASHLPDGGVPVAISQPTAQAHDLHIGQRLGLVIGDLRTGTRVPPLVVAAIYQPLSPADPLWQESSPPLGASSYEVLSERDFSTLSLLTPSSNPQFSWDLSIPIRAVHFGAAGAITANLARLTALVARLAPGATVFTLLGGNLTAFTGAFALLGVLLYVLAAPVVLIILYYLTVSTTLVLDRQAGEIVLMRSRGAAARHIVVVYGVEGLLLGAGAVATGPLLAVPLATKISQTSGFLQFSRASAGVGRLDPGTFIMGAAVTTLAVLASMMPALGAAWRTMVTHKQEQARSGRPPLWQRIHADMILLIVALYGYSVLSRQGALTPSQNQSALVQDPFVAIAPGLFLLGGTLLFGRMVPQVSTVVAVLLRHVAMPLGMAVQTIARTPRQYVRLAMLLSLTLSLGVFAAAVAGTIRANLDDQYRYRAGSALRVVEAAGASTSSANALPIAWHLRLPGVHHASAALRLAAYQCDLTSGNVTLPADVLGIDPATFGQVAWFRPDFATLPLPRLLDLLRNPTQPGVLVAQSFLDQSKARVGDQVQLSVGGSQPVPVTILGAVRYFPTLDPVEHVYAIGNLASIKALSGISGPTEVWMSADRDPATITRVITAVQRTGRMVVDYEDRAPGLTIVDNPLQVGIYGVTSLGFLVAVMLSMMGLVASLSLSLERRARDFGVLRALGSSTAQVAAMLLLEQLFLVTSGVVAALLIGLLGARLFIPYLPIVQFTTPPFVVNTPWGDVVRLVLILLGGFVVALALSSYALTRVQINRIVRLGEA